MNFGELFQWLWSQISMWLSCQYSTEGMKEAGERLKCCQHLSSGGCHSSLVLFVYSLLFLTCSSRLLQYSFLSPSPSLARPISSVCGSPDTWSTFSNLFPVLKNPSSRHHLLSCGDVGLWDCTSSAAIFSKRLPGEITRLRGDFPLPWEHFFCEINSGMFQ